MLFDHCSKCQSCCRIDDGFPPLEITLNKAEKKRLGSLCVETSCNYLGENGCTLGHEKPFGCQLYPLSYDPNSQNFFFDAACPLMMEYREQLKQPSSEASRHLSSMKMLISTLQVDDPDFLVKNFSVDVDYFEIQPLLQTQNSKKNKS